MGIGIIKNAKRARGFLLSELIMKSENPLKALLSLQYQFKLKKGIVSVRFEITVTVIIQFTPFSTHPGNRL